MALIYTGPGGLFTVLGQIFGAHESLGTVRSTTIKAQIQQAVDAYKLKTTADLQFDRAINAAARAEQTWRTAGDTLAAALARDAAGLLTEVVKADSDTVFRGQLAEALQYLIDEMLVDDVFVAPATVTAVYAADADNSATDLALFVWTYDHLTRQLDTSIAESIEVLCTEGGASLEQQALATLRFRGERGPRNKLSEEFPADAGSGIERTIRPLTPSDSLLSNGGFEDATIANIPDDWIVKVGTPGTTLLLTTWESQTITITGTPSAGTYQVQLTDPVTGLVHLTEALDYDATADDLQTALRAVTGLAIDLSEITVTATGTSPNFVHTVEFVGVRGNLALMTVLNNTTAGSFAVAQVAAGDNLSVQGRGLKMTAHASVLQAIFQPITLKPDTVYFLGYWLTPSTTPTQGVFTASINNETEVGSVVSPHTGVGGGQATDLTLIASKTARGFFFSLPSRSAAGDSVAGPLYVCLNKGTAEPTADIVIDEVVLVEATQLYPGGPYVAALAGNAGVVEGDLWTLAVGNNYASKWQKYFDAFFDTAGKRKLLPTAGSTQIAEALVS